MKPPGKTTLPRMQETALDEQHRIEISQDGRVRCGMQQEPMPGQVLKRDDFAGIVKLIDIIMSDAAILERLQERLRAAPIAPHAGGGKPDASDAEGETS